MLKAILFDLDDTLIDWSQFTGGWEAYESHHLKFVFDHICEEYVALESFDEFMREYVTRTRNSWEEARHDLRAPHVGRVLLDTAAHFGVDDSRFDMARCLEVYGWGKVEGTALFPDVVEALTMLRDKGIRFGIVTNAYQPMLLREMELSQHKLLDYFPECRISAADVGYLKPHPQIFEKALSTLGTSPEETLFIGDNPVADIAGAQGAGMKAILRVKHPAPPLISGLVVPDGAINSLLELPPILDDLYPGW